MHARSLAAAAGQTRASVAFFPLPVTVGTATELLLCAPPASVAALPRGRGGFRGPTCQGRGWQATQRTGAAGCCSLRQPGLRHALPLYALARLRAGIVLFDALAQPHPPTRPGLGASSFLFQPSLHHRQQRGLPCLFVLLAGLRDEARPGVVASRSSQSVQSSVTLGRPRPCCLCAGPLLLRRR